MLFTFSAVKRVIDRLVYNGHLKGIQRTCLGRCGILHHDIISWLRVNVSLLE